MDVKELRELNEKMSQVNDYLKKLSSFKYSFFLAIIKGVGNAIGATVVAAVLVYFLSKFVEGVGGIPFLQQFLDQFIK